MQAQRLESRLRERTAVVAVVGLGYVGRPLAAAVAAAGYCVLGYDTDVERAGVAGESDAHGVTTTSDPALLAEAEVFLICVPTPLGPEREPDLAYVRAASECVAEALVRHSGGAREALVVLESTTWPGSTREVVGGVLARRGLVLGRDVWLAHSPERLDPGTSHAELAAIPKLVGGTCARSGELAHRFYASFVTEVHLVRSAEVAESAKLLENVFRAVNIALVNELKLALGALDVDIWEVVEAAATKPFGFMKFTPGPGMGGHCLPVDPFYLAWALRRAGRPSRFIELAGEINREQPRHVVECTAAALEERGTAVAGARVLVVGLAYKAGIDDVRESPAVRILELLAELGADVRYSDSRVGVAPEWVGPGLVQRESVELAAGTVAEFDAVILATVHPELDLGLLAEHARLLIDTRGALRARLGADPRYRQA